MTTNKKARKSKKAEKKYSQKELAEIIQDCLDGCGAFVDKYNDDWGQGYDDGVRDVTDGIKRRIGLDV